MLAGDFNAFSIATLTPHWHGVATRCSNCVTGCLIATEKGLVTLNDVAKPFANFEKMKTTAATRRHIHQETAEVPKRGLKSQSTSQDQSDSDPAEVLLLPRTSVDISTDVTASVPTDETPY